ncbi:MAG TPA: TonB-dependent receptor [Vicinamibacterales bacterium]
MLIVAATGAPVWGQTGVGAGSDPGLTLVGQVVDARTGTPLAQVLVSVEDAAKSALTGADGRFAIPDVPAGAHRLYVSVVGYALFRREITIGPDPPPLTIRLSEGTTAYTETVTVTPDVFRAPPEPVASASVLGNAELQNLRGVLADDPLRAVQVLPGVATGDDLRSEFTVRGSDFRHLTFTVDGFDTPYLLHTVRGLENKTPTGSVAMINSDVLQDVTLLNGGYPQRYGGHTGAELDFRLRDGSRDRTIVRAAVSGTAASGVAEGPIGSNGRGSWLVSGRQSYIDYLVHRLTSHAVSFGFSDAQGRASYDLSPRQRLDFTVLAGRSRFQNEPGHTAPDDLFDATNASAVGVASWTLTLSKAVLTQRVLAAENHFRNHNTTGGELETGTDHQLAYRADAVASLSGSLQTSAGGSIEHASEARVANEFNTPTGIPIGFDDWNAKAWRGGAYAMVQWKPRSTITISPGLRGDYSGVTGQSAGSPWLQTEWRVRTDTILRASAGRYVQMADFDHVFGAAGNPNARPERAVQYDLGVERRFRRTWRAAVTGYDREERDMLRQPLNDTRLVTLPSGSTVIVRADFTTRFYNELNGYARGVEFLLQRMTTGRGLSGSIAYGYGLNRYHDFLRHESYWGDFDQRHTFNGFLLYTHSDRTSVVVKLRMGSNFPIPGYYSEHADGTFYVGSARNTARLPVYSRLDLRANRTFSWSHHRVTGFAEVINVLNRENVRFLPPSVNTRTNVVGAPFEKMLPVVPSVGVLIEF